MSELWLISQLLCFQNDLEEVGKTENCIIDCLVAMVVKLSEVTFRPLFFKVSILPLHPICTYISYGMYRINYFIFFSCLIGLRQKMPQKTDC